MNLLQIPIIDEFWVAPQDPASQHRTKDFAISMGFGELVTPQQEAQRADRRRAWLRDNHRGDCGLILEFGIPVLYTIHLFSLHLYSICTNIS